MVNSFINLLIILTLRQQDTVKSAISPETRMELLKHELLAEIQNEQIRTDPPPAGASVLKDFYKFVGIPLDDGPVKPIIQHDKNHIHKHHIRNVTNTSEHRNETRLRLRPKRKRRIRQRSTFRPTKTPKIQYTTSKITPADVYLRRYMNDEEMDNKPVKWAHCVHFITPYFKSYNDSVIFKKVGGVKDETVIKLTQLLSTNTSESTRAEIIKKIHEISNLHIKIFNWDVNAVNALFNVLSPEANHSFKTIRAGLKRIFNRWQLDMSYLAAFRKQMKIIKPPCIKVSEFEGSTKSPKRPLYTKPTTKDTDDEDYD